MKKTTLLPLLLATALPGIALAENAQEIAKGFDTQKVTAIETYIKDNPKADDMDDALSILIDAHKSMGGLDALPDLLAKRYDLQDKGSEGDLQMIVSEIIHPYITIAGGTGQKEKAKEFVAKVKADFANHPLSSQLNGFLDQMAGELSLPSAGDDMNIAFKALDGQDIDTSKMKDKVVLIDFWATWCGPCRAEMPNVIAAYGKYKDKGFEIIGISLDEDKDALDKVLADEKITWPQYYDGKGWENKIAREFGISSIPATFLLGKDGKIIASNLRGPDLEAAIEKALE